MSRLRIYIVPFSSEPAAYKALLLVRGKPRLQPKLGQWRDVSNDVFRAA